MPRRYDAARWVPRRGRAAIQGAALLATSWVHGCGRDGTAAADAALDLLPYPTADSAPGEAIPSVLAVDFTVSDCPQLDQAPTPGAPRCSGRAPLTLKFIPINSVGIDRYLWDFGDATAKSSDATPSHTYALPGTYDVTLVGAGPNGTVSKPRVGFVTVTQNALGEACDVDAQCTAGLICVCGAAAKCPTAFARGICTASCRDRPCAVGAVCADFSLEAAKPEPWQQPLCLKSCEQDHDCGAGLRCRDLPGHPASAPWTRACFASIPGDLGASCRSASGVLRSEMCITSFCANLGANGLCSLQCGGMVKCPAGTICAEMKNGQDLCLRPCGPTFACDGDPMLACAKADISGPLGFRVSAASANVSFCSAKRCTTSAECGPAGLCTEESDGAHCVRK